MTNTSDEYFVTINGVRVPRNEAARMADEETSMFVRPKATPNQVVIPGSLHAALSAWFEAQSQRNTEDLLTEARKFFRQGQSLR